jgi:hypothetical protein
VIAAVGITDEVDRAAGLAEEGHPNSSTVDICPDRCFGECLRKSVLAFCSRPPRTCTRNHFHRCATSLRLEDLVLATDRYPYLEEMIGILNVYPRVHVDTGAVDWIEPGFLSYLQQLLRYGFEKRIMFGSDQMTWPDAIGKAVEAIEKADFLSAEQKRDILYNNAARFLRLPPEQIARHHGDSNK